MRTSLTRKRVVRALVLVLAAVVIGTVFVASVRARRFQHHLKSAQIGLAQLETALAGGQGSLLSMIQHPSQLTALHSTVLTLEADLEAMEDLAGPLLAVSDLLGWVPKVGGDIVAAPHLLRLARQTTEATSAALEGLEPLAARLDEGVVGLRSLAPLITEGLLQAQPQFRTARSAFAQASLSRQAVDAGRLSPKLRALVDRFDRYQPTLSLGLDSVEVLPGLLGADAPKRYLVLAQNSDELRATGGFISGVGEVQLEHSRLAGVKFQDSYTVDNLEQTHPQPPAPLRRYMQAGMLVFRDANWWPDFPTSARMIADLYRQDTGAPSDGVVAVDLTTLQMLVAELGPIEVPGYQEPVSTENLRPMLMAYWQVPRLAAPGKEATDWWSHRKDFAADLLLALLQKTMERATAEDLMGLARTLGTALRQRHLLVYVKDPATQALLHRAHWDGAVRDSPGDYLMVVDSNVGFNKVNPNIEQTLSYDLVLDASGTITAQLTLTYRHRILRPTPACVHEPRYGDSYEELMERCYWDYVRIYLPAGSDLLELSGSDSPAEVYEEANRTVVGTAFLLETGQSRRIQVAYRPRIVAGQGLYTLLVQKQPGAEAISLRIRVRLPEGSGPARAQPDPIAAADNEVIWQGTLDQDWEVSLSWK